MDYIHRPGVPAEKKPGGILYSAVSLAVISGPGSEIFPVMNLGADEYENIISFLSGFSNIKFDFINKLYSGFNPDHYVITVDERKKWPKKINPIYIENYDQLNSLLDNLIDGKRKVEAQQKTIKKEIEEENGMIILTEDGFVKLNGFSIELENKMNELLMKALNK